MAVEDELHRLEAALAFVAQQRGDVDANLVRRVRARVGVLRAERDRLVLIEGLSWPLTPAAHASVLDEMRRASDLIARAAPEPAVVSELLAGTEIG